MFQFHIIQIRIVLIFSLIALSWSQALAQYNGKVEGTLNDENKKGIPFANVSVLGTTIGSYTDSVGHYSLEVPTNRKIKLAFSHINYDTQTFEVMVKVGETKQLHRIL
ncbi:MAG: carboxypeptidase-like regulatory domain-containing protein, partial [Flavobacteriales bacterium]|nr:carboxypeptidase-like regulatory domain-containing protein [Flavobacteriales bacterium]